ncbi:MAG: hypothetical protein P8R54_14920 [Myxococcota bacterium]|nr:hypothetical protein [Myxococcota bacterium]
MQPTTTQDAQSTQAVESTLPMALSLASAIAEHGDEVELQGTVLHRDRALTLAAGAAIAAVVTMLGQLTPLPGIALLLLILLSFVEDLEGGTGWLRRLVVLKDVGHNVILWRAPRLPTRSTPPAESRPPWLAEGALSHRPALLICVPADGLSGERVGLRRLHIAVSIATLLAAIGIGLWTPLATIAAGGLALLSGGLTLRHVQAPPRLTPSPAIPATLTLLDALRAQPPEHLAVAVAFIEGSSGHTDGIEILLENYAPILPPHLTRVLSLVPDEIPLSAQHIEGVLQRRSADALILRAADGLSKSAGVSPTARVLRRGWRGATLRGDLTNTAAILKVIDRLDQAAGADQWS